MIFPSDVVEKQFLFLQKVENKSFSVNSIAEMIHSFDKINKYVSIGVQNDCDVIIS